LVSVAGSFVGWVKRNAAPPIPEKTRGEFALRLTHSTFLIR
jgi:hypothetical protein